MEKVGISSRKQQALETRKKIIDKSIKLMSENCIANIKIEDISKEAGVSVGTIYHHFKSKNDIFFELYVNADQYFKESVEIKGENSCEKIKCYFSQYFEFNKNRGLDELNLLYTAENKNFITKGRYMQGLLISILEEGQEKKEITTEADAQFITEYLFIAARGLIFNWGLHDGSYDLIEKGSEFMKPIIEIFTIKG